MLIHVPPEADVLAMDVHKNTISTGLLVPGSFSPVIDKISTDEESIRRLVGRFADPGRVWACYEAGPTGYELPRTFRLAGMHAEVIAPSLIPARPGDRIKTHRRDASRMALLFRAGQLSSVRVPTVAEEALLLFPWVVSAVRVFGPGVGLGLSVDGRGVNEGAALASSSVSSPPGAICCAPVSVTVVAPLGAGWV